jgi:hypothetical protein
MMLASHFYYTGLSGDYSGRLLKDPVDQLRWTRDNLPYFSALAKQLQLVRNALVHNGYLDKTRICHLVSKLETQKQKTANFLLDYLLDLLLRALSCSEHNLEATRSRCQLCGTLVSHEPPLEINSNRELITFPDKFVKLSNVKENLILKEQIKGKKVKIMSQSKYYGIEGRFRSWSGSVCYIDLDGYGKHSFSVSQTVVEILE